MQWPFCVMTLLSNGMWFHGHEKLLVRGVWALGNHVSSQVGSRFLDSLLGNIPLSLTSAFRNRESLFWQTKWVGQKCDFKDSATPEM